MMDLASTGSIGNNLNRPESVLCTQDGDFFVSHKGHGVARIRADSTQFLLAPQTDYCDLPLLPNGIALRQDGSFLLANIADGGGIFELDSEGIRPLITQIAGETAPPINFVTLDERGRIWFSVSSTYTPRHLAYRHNVKNGFVGIVENGQARIVLDGLHYTNEIRPDLENGWLYVSETFGQHISRFPLRANGSVGERQIYAQFPSGAFVDGIALDADGGLWAACIVSNELFHVPSGGSPRVFLSERNDLWVEEVEQALTTQTMDRYYFDHAPTSTLRNMSSVAFHGEALNKLVCGSLLGDSLITIDAPVIGRPPVHWNVTVPQWGQPFE